MDAPAPPTEITTDAWFRSCVERMADFVCAIDAEGTIVYANPATTAWLGISPDDLVGRSCLDIVHPDDVERAIGTIAYGRGSDRAEVPVTFRLRSADGWGAFDVRGHGLRTDPSGQTMLIVARENDRSELLDELLDSLARGAEIAETVDLIARVLVHPLWEDGVAVIYRDADGVRRVAHAGLSAELAAVFEPDRPSPWKRAAQRGEQVTVRDLDGVDEASAAVLRAAGFSSLLVVPVTDPLADEPVCLVVCAHEWLNTWDLGIAVEVERVKRLLRVALGQRYHRTMLERAARTDPLTGLSNRRHFFDALDAELDRLARDGDHRVAVTYLDLDGFKLVNDTYGHGAGDEVLRQVASRLGAVYAGVGLVARMGGDEFAAIVLSGDADRLSADAAAAVAAPVQLREGTVEVGVSTGTSYALTGDRARAVVDRADSLAYEAKRARR